MVVGALLAAAGLTAGCGDPDPGRTPGPNDGAGLEFDVDARITVDDDGFDPPTLQVQMFDTIEVTNAGDEPHGLQADLVDTGRMLPGETTTLFVDRPGTIEYLDPQAPDHTGTIEVAPAG